MTHASNRLPSLFIAACILLGIGVVGFGGIFILELPPHISEGFRYIFVGFILFGIGEILNHPKTTTPTASSGIQQVCRRRNVCSLGNLFGIGALLLFFVGLSALLFPQ
jgi:hypothetical protein